MEPEPGVGFTLQMGAVAAARVAIMVAITLQLTLSRRTEHFSQLGFLLPSLHISLRKHLRVPARFGTPEEKMYLCHITKQLHTYKFTVTAQTWTLSFAKTGIIRFLTWHAKIAFQLLTSTNTSMLLCRLQATTRRRMEHTRSGRSSSWRGLFRIC